MVTEASSSIVPQVGILSSKLIGFLLSITANTLVACSFTLQKSAHNQLATKGDRFVTSEGGDVETAVYCSAEEKPLNADSEMHQQQQSYVCHPTWLFGIVFMALGETGNFAALAFAPASLVTPLGAWSVVLSSVLAWLFLREHVSRSRMLGIITCVTGALLIGISGPDVGETEAKLSAMAVVELLQQRAFLIFIVCVFAAVTILMTLEQRTALGHQNIFICIGVSSLLGSVTVVSAKALSMFVKLTLMGNSQFGTWISGVLIFVLASAVVLQLRYLNLSMARFGNVEVVPIYYVMFTSCAMTSSVILYREYETMQTSNIPFFIGVIATMLGVFMIHRGEKLWPSDNEEWTPLLNRGRDPSGLGLQLVNYDKISIST